MPYYVPQKEAAATAALARSLMGLGFPPSIARRNPTMYARPASSSIAARAAASMMLPRRSQRTNTAVMSGMGLGILPTVNVRYAKTAIPAAMAERRRLASIRTRRQSMSGLGKAHAMQVPVVAGYRRQPGFFMGPGGGPGGGPFQMPAGYGVPIVAGATMSGQGLRWLGQDDGFDTTPIDTYSYPIDGTLTPPTFDDSTPLPFLPSVQPIDTTSTIISGSLVPPTSAAAPNPYAGSSPSFVPANQAAPQGLLPSVAPTLFQQIGSSIASIFGGSAAAARPAGAGAQPSASMNLSGVLPIVLVGALGFGIVKSLGGKKRR